VAQSLASVLGNYQANQMEGQRQSALAQALSSGTPDELINSGIPELQQAGQFKLEQQQREAAAAHQAAQDERQARQDAAAAERQASEPPHVQEIKGPNGETLGLAQWDRAQRRYVPFQAPEGVARAAGLGGIAQSNKPLTEGEAKLSMYTNRAVKSNDLLSGGADTALTDLTSTMAAQAPGALAPLGNYMKTPGYRDAEGWGGEFLTAILRQESQATIRPDEMRDYGKVFLPQPGDQPRDIERKRGARVRAIEGLKLGLASRDILLQEIDRQRGGLAPPGSPPASVAPPPAAAPPPATPAAAGPQIMGGTDSGNRPAPLPQIMTPADFATLPSGAHFLDPNGDERVKP
jgi:hypothetical protein